MSVERKVPPVTEIALVYDGDRWTARDVESGATATGDTREDALDALDTVVERENGGPDSIDSDDPFWTADPVAPGGPTDLSERVDEYLYGSVEDE